jgi:signal transduction histidine kinase
MITPVGIIPLLVIVAGVALLIAVQTHKERARPGRAWLLALVIMLGLTAATYFIPDGTLWLERFGRGAASVLTLAGLVITFGTLLLQDISGQQPRLWLMAAGVGLALLVVLALVEPIVLTGEEGWLATWLAAPDAVGIVVLVGLVASAVMLIASAFAAYYRATLPEVGNRALLWAMLAMALFSGIALMLSGQPLLTQAGLLAAVSGVVGSTYAHLRHRAFDLRGRFISIVQTSGLLLLTAITIFAATALAQQLGILREASAAALLLVLALLVALLYLPLRQWLEYGLARLLGSSTVVAFDHTTASRRYSQQITRSLDLRQLTQTLTQTLNDVMNVRGSGLILVNAPDKSDGSVAMRLMHNGEGGTVRGRLNQDSLIWKRWQGDRVPLTQYDMEYNPTFTTLDESEKKFFHNSGMSAYAPIIVDDTVIGVLAVGGKRDDTPFYPRDLDLLATMADQTGVALRNARLVADLRQLNDEMQVLNRGLEATKEQMEKLDAVKTDFITIASHELRTPLAQIRGYIDLVDALNDQGMVDQDRLEGMVGNVRSATQRMEELISAMLDVSQLDVKAMDLRFTDTSLESILRMAIEPLVDAARQRKLSLVARGLRGLPLVEADMQRLTQAFRNVIVNAIKFTPDGGRIDISAETKPPRDDEDHPRVVVSIADTGVGIDAENLELIFRKFYRAYDPSLHSTGTYKFMGAGPGLGLTIAQGVIEGHGGRIWVESPGHDMESCPGSTFYIELPVKLPQDAKGVMRFNDHDPQG